MKKRILRISIITCICILGLFCKGNTCNAGAWDNSVSVLMLPNTSRTFKISEAQGKVKWRLGPNGKNVKVTQSGKISVKKDGRATVYATYKVKKITYVRTYHIYTLGKKYDKEYLNYISKKTVNKYKKAYQKKSTKGLSKSEKKVYKRLKKALDTTKGCKTKAKKELAIHDWIVNNTVYTYATVTDNSHLPSNYSYVGVFTNGKAVCEGYAQAFKLCMDILGIPCEYIVGYEEHNLLNAHLWNRVKLDDGKWYQVDCTFDDPTNDSSDTSGFTNRPRYNYFNCTDAQMKDHVYVNTRKCKGTKYSAKNMKKSLFVDTQKEWYDAIKTAAAQGKTKFRIFRNANLQVDANNYLLSMYVGKSIEKVTRLSVMYSVRNEIAPGKKEYNDCIYKIQYADNQDVEKITYIDSAAQFEELIQSSVTAGKAKLENVVFTTKLQMGYNSYYRNEGVLYDLTGKHILLDGFGTIVDLPSYMNKAGDTYQYLGEITINYTNQNDVVNVPETIDEFIDVLEDAITNRQTSVIIYGKGLDYDALGEAIRKCEAKYQDHSVYQKITYYDPIGQFEFVHPENGVVAKPLWYQFEFEY